MILTSDLDPWQELDCNSKVGALMSGRLEDFFSQTAGPGFRPQPIRRRSLARLKYAMLRDDAFVFSAPSEVFLLLLIPSENP
jgi:hypothetical protein